MKMGIVLFLKHVPSLPSNLFRILYLYGLLDSIQRKVLFPTLQPHWVCRINWCSSDLLEEQKRGKQGGRALAEAGECRHPPEVGGPWGSSWVTQYQLQVSSLSQSSKSLKSLAFSKTLSQILSNAAQGPTALICRGVGQKFYESLGQQ